MAFRIPLSELSEEQIKKILKVLTIKPKVEEKNKFNKAPPKKFVPIQAFTIHQYSDNGNGDVLKEGEEDDSPEYINLPFFISQKLLTEQQYEKYKRTNYPTFDTKLHPYQEKLRDDKFKPLSEARKQIKKFSTTSIKLPPGYGKTIFGAALWWIYQVKALVLIENKTLIDQHYNSFVSACPTLKDRMWRVGVDKKMPKDPVVIICMEERIKKIPGNLLDEIGMLIVDEAHKMCTESRIEPLLTVRPKYVVIQTATLGRVDQKHNVIYALAGRHCIFKISNKAHTVVIYDTKIKIPVVTNQYGPNFSELQKSLSQSDEYNEMVMDFISRNTHRKFIVLANLTEHVKKLERMAKERGIEYDSLYENKDKYNDSLVLFGTLSKIGTGFDEANACQNFKGRKSDTLILLSSISVDIKVKDIPKDSDPSLHYSDEELASISRIEQVRGRVMRADTEPYIIYFSVDHPTHKKHIRGYKAWIPIVNGRLTHSDVSDELILPLP